MGSRVFMKRIANGNDVILDSETITAGSVLEVSETVPGPSTNLAITLAIDVSALKGLWISCDQDVTIKTNSSGSPADTLNVDAGCPLAWTENSPDANPLGTDVTVIYVTTTAEDDATLRMVIMTDPTPS